MNLEKGGVQNFSNVIPTSKKGECFWLVDFISRYNWRSESSF